LPEGFTIVELLLALSLVVLLAGLAAVSFSDWQEAAQVGAGTERLQAVLRLTRAQAANQCRCFRLAFHPEGLQPEIQWEPSPLAEPGQFVIYPGEWARDLLDKRLSVRLCQRRGPSATWLTAAKESDKLSGPDGGVIEPIMFFPDGSCDSASIEIIDANDDQTRVGRLDIDGSTGAMELQVFTPTEYQEFQQNQLEAQSP